MDKTTKKYSFTVEYTTFAKAVAVILMVVVHSTMDYAGYGNYTTVENIICSLFKPVVSMFAILSGFGMMKSAKKTKNMVRLSLKRIVLVLVGYWMVFIVLFARIIVFITKSLEDIYGRRITLSLLKDIFGCSHVGPITKSIMPISWFIGTIIIFYLLFPLLHMLIFKLGKLDFILLIISFIPIALLGFKISLYTWDSIVYFMFSFVLGMYIEKHRIFEWFVRKKNEAYWRAFPIVAITTIILGFLRVYVGPLVDPLCGVTFIVFLIFIVNKIKILDRVLLFIGGIEFFIYLIHYSFIKQCSAMINHHSIWIYLVAFTFTVIASVIYEFFYSKIKNYISKLKVFN